MELLFFYVCWSEVQSQLMSSDAKNGNHDPRQPDWRGMFRAVGAFSSLLDLPSFICQFLYL